MFLEAGFHLLRSGGRLGMLVPSGTCTDKGTADLRRTFLGQCSWEWSYGFVNQRRIFPIHGGYKFNALVVERGGSTEVVRMAAGREDLYQWERPGGGALELAVSDIKRFSPNTWSFMEFRSRDDLRVTEAIYADHPLLGDVVERDGARYASEFHMANGARHFVSRRKLEQSGILAPGIDSRDPRLRAQAWRAGFLPLYEGRSFWMHDPYFSRRGTIESVSKFVALETVLNTLVTRSWADARLVFRDVTHSSTNRRTLISAVMPRGVHGNKAPSIDGLGDPFGMVALFGSLVMDYIVRMKVYVTINWFYAETLPVPNWTESIFGAEAGAIARRLNAVGEDFGARADAPLVDSFDRYSARLLIDVLTADLFRLHPDDVAHIASAFPKYDRQRDLSLRYTSAVVQAYAAWYSDGPEAGRAAIRRLAMARRDAGVGFSLDLFWQPEDGWARANAEAREIDEDEAA